MLGPENRHPTEVFRQWMREHLPAELHPIGELVPVGDRLVRGVAAFPASHGLYAPCGSDPDEVPPFPFGGLVAVGNHLDAENKYERRRASGEPHGDPCPGASRMPFWRVLYSVVDEAEIERRHLFATNVHPALRPGDDPSGEVRRSAAGYADWAARCCEFLRLQIDTMRPRVLVAMGSPAAAFIGTLLSVPRDSFNHPQRYAIGDQLPVVIAVAHPSARPVHVARREYGGAIGRAADVHLLRDAWHGADSAPIGG